MLEYATAAQRVCMKPASPISKMCRQAKCCISIRLNVLMDCPGPKRWWRAGGVCDRSGHSNFSSSSSSLHSTPVFTSCDHTLPHLCQAKVCIILTCTALTDQLLHELFTQAWSDRNESGFKKSRKLKSPRNTHILLAAMSSKFVWNCWDRDCPKPLLWNYWVADTDIWVLCRDVHA